MDLMKVDSQTLSIIEKDKLKYDGIMRKIGLKAESDLDMEVVGDTIDS
jgi:hypothetical protein